jgi:hypothetical protein
MLLLLLLLQPAVEETPKSDADDVGDEDEII